MEQSAVAGYASPNLPYTSIGLLGDNQIISIADTGLDINSCYFYDSQGSVAPSDINSPVSNPIYRKVVQYSYCTWGACDTGDYSAGHGTHVAGTG